MGVSVMRTAFLQASSVATFVAIWIAVYALVNIVFSDSPAKVAYAVLSAWWCSLYVSRLLQLRPITCVWIIAIYVIYALSAAAFQLPHFYHDAPETLNMLYVLVSFGAGIVMAAPILVDWVVRDVIERRLRS